VDEIGVAAGFAERFQQPRGAFRVQLQRLVERLLEGDRRRAVDHHVDAGHAGDLALQVAGDRLDFAAVQALEDLASEDVLEAPVGVAAEEHREARLRQLVQALGEHGLADEPGGSRQQ
jgi:hypothetical protein